jgi:hypothetical protein
MDAEDGRSGRGLDDQREGSEGGWRRRGDGSCSSCVEGAADVYKLRDTAAEKAAPLVRRLAACPTSVRFMAQRRRGAVSPARATATTQQQGQGGADEGDKAEAGEGGEGKMKEASLPRNAHAVFRRAEGRGKQRTGWKRRGAGKRECGGRRTV